MKTIIVYAATLVETHTNSTGITEYYVWKCSEVVYPKPRVLLLHLNPSLPRYGVISTLLNELQYHTAPGLTTKPVTLDIDGIDIIDAYD